MALQINPILDPIGLWALMVVFLQSDCERILIDGDIRQVKHRVARILLIGDFALVIPDGGHDPGGSTL